MLLFPPAASRAKPPGPKEFFGVFRHGVRGLQLVWTTSRWLTVLLGGLTIVAGSLPVAATVVAGLIVDAVVQTAGRDLPGNLRTALIGVVLLLVLLEAVIAVALTAAQRGLTTCQSLLRAQLGHRVNVLVLEKALTLELAHFEDSEVYDKMTRARREASIRPLSLVTRTFGLLQNAITLAGLGGLLVAFSPWVLVIVAVAGLPAFVAETKFSGDAFQLFRWRSPEARKQAYLETVMAREDYAKEVQLFELGHLLMDRYVAIFRDLYRKDRDLTYRRNLWGWALGLIGIAALLAVHVWIVVRTIAGTITIGDMAMYLLAFKQGQSAVAASLSAIGGMYEDNLYLSNLFEFLELPVPVRPPGEDRGPLPSDGLRFEHVTFTYPGADEPCLRDVSFHLEPGRKLALVGENGAGKTTLIKLLTRLYAPDSGRIILDGRDLREWDDAALRRRIGVIFQDFVRYQFTVGENIGVGDVDHFTDEARWRDSADKGLATEFIERLPDRFRQQLGRWFQDGRELSTGQWQKMALARAFMRSGADLLVLDEPTASMDAEAEARVFEHFRRLTERQMAILISHRFSTVRMADQIAVMEEGRIVEMGSHDELVARGGRYARLFDLQAAGYR